MSGTLSLLASVRTCNNNSEDTSTGLIATMSLFKMRMLKWVCHLVIIHDGIERFDPHWVNISIKYDPLGMIISQVRHVSHDTGEQTILPLPGSWIDEAK